MTAPNIQQPTPEHIAEAADALRRGQLVAMPTETVYGLAADALNPKAVAAIFQAKGRPHFDPLIVHVPDTSTAQDLAADWPPIATQLAERFWPGPLTLVLPKQPHVPDLVTAGLPSVAIRCPEHPVALQLLRAAQTPLAAPSANRFGGISPTQPQHVAQELPDKVALILDGGPAGRGVESTVISLTSHPPALLRPGALPIEDIEALTGPLARPQPSDNPAQPQASPGRLDRHYAPGTPMLLYKEALPPAGVIAQAVSGQDVPVALLTLGPDPDAASHYPWHQHISLSPTGDLLEAAAALFATLRTLDQSPAQLIVAQLPTQNHGLAPAITDRLQRGATFHHF